MDTNIKFQYEDGVWKEKTGPKWNDYKITDICAFLPIPYYQKNDTVKGIPAYFPFNKGPIEGVASHKKNKGTVYSIWAKLINMININGQDELKLVICYTTIHNGHVEATLLSDQANEWIAIEI